jgi:ADP-heptose:LPS heptosyltransferase
MVTGESSSGLAAQAAPSREGLPAAPGVPGRWGYLVRNRALVSALWLTDHLPWPRVTRVRPEGTPRRLLVAMIGNFGDCLVASALLARIAAASPETEIGLLVAPPGAALFRGDPRVRHLHVIDHFWLSRAADSRWARLRRHVGSRRVAIRQMRAIGYDAAVDLYYHFPSVAPIPWAADIPVRVGYASGGFRRFLTRALPWVLADRHVAEYQADLLPETGIPRARLDAAGALRTSLPALRAPAPMALPARYTVLHMGAGAPEREWPEEGWMEVAADLAARGMPMLLTGRGPREAERCARLAQKIPGATDLSNLLDTAQLRTVMGGAALVICLDSMAAHLAALDAVPTIVLRAGITNPAHWRPLNDRAVVLYVRTPCLPCYNWRGCASMACIREVTAHQVIAAAAQLLGPA